MKKVVAILLTMIVAVTMVGCGSTSSAEKPAEKAEAEKVVKLGILQIVEHPALDSAREGFIESLEAEGFEEGKNLKIDYQNAQGDQTNLTTMANKLVTDGNDLILAIATPSAQALVNVTDEIPIIITAVTDPVAAKLVLDMDKPGTNVTGTSDMNPVPAQLELIKKISPEVKTLGIIYNAGEVNSTVQVELVKASVEAAGITEIVEATVSTSAEVMQATQSIVDRVDALYIPTDNTVISAYDSVVAVSEENKLPLFPAESSSLEKGGVATVGVNYLELGKQTGKMAVRVINGENPAEMPVELQANPNLTINKTGAKNIGVEIDETILNEADEIIE